MAHHLPCVVSSHFRPFLLTSPSLSLSQGMIKLFSLKQQKKDAEAAGASGKKTSASQLRITKGMYASRGVRGGKRRFLRHLTPPSPFPLPLPFSSFDRSQRAPAALNMRA